MSNERPIKKPGRSGAAFRSGPMVENPGKMLGRLMGYIFKNYRIHIIVVVIGIVVSVLANVQGTMFMKTLIDQYIMPMLQSETPDFHPLAMAILRVACFYAIGVACTYTYNRLMIYVSQGIFEMRCLSAWKHFLLNILIHMHMAISCLSTPMILIHCAR